MQMRYGQCHDGDMKKFPNRREAGLLLAARLSAYADRDDVLVLGLPRGGVPVAYEVARRLHAPLDVFVVRKLGVPACPELAMGAVATGEVRVLNTEIVLAYGISEPEIDEITAAEKQELRRREIAYRGHEGSPEVRGKTVILIDDGVATGSTIKAAVRALEIQLPARVIVAVPVAPASCDLDLADEVDEFITLIAPTDFSAVGQWYDDFGQTSDDEVVDLLRSAAL